MGGRGGGGSRAASGDGAPTASSAPAAAAPAPATSGLEDRIVDVLSRFENEPGGLVSLVRVRHELSDIDRSTLDAQLKRLMRAGRINIDPSPNTKALPPEAHAAAMRFGGTDQHFISQASRNGR